MRKISFILFGALILFSVIIGFIIFSNDSKNVSGNFVSSNDKSNSGSDKDSGTNYGGSGEGVGETGDVKTEGGSGGVSSSTEGSGGNLNCQQIQVSYSVKNLKTTSECENYLGEICINKKIQCSFEVYNLDKEVSGDFGFNIYVFKDEDVANIIDSLYSEKFIPNLGNETFEGDFMITSNGPDGNANQNLSCFYGSAKIPLTFVC